MSYTLLIGDRVTWTVRGKKRTGTIELYPAWSSQAYVKPDQGNEHWISKTMLTKIEKEGGAKNGV